MGMETCRRVLADAAGAFVITLLVGFVLASLSAAGVVTMTLATIFLALAWLVGIWFTFLIKPIVEMSLLHKSIFAGVLAIGLIVVWCYELSRQAKASSDELHVAQTNQTIIAPNNNGIITHGQTGGSNTVIQGPIARHLMDIENIPKNRHVSVSYTVSESDAEGFATELKNFLEQNGYSVDGPNSAMFFDPVHGVQVVMRKDNPTVPIEILVGNR
jgi:hypothetical protein